MVAASHKLQHDLQLTSSESHMCNEGCWKLLQKYAQQTLEELSLRTILQRAWLAMRRLFVANLVEARCTPRFYALFDGSLALMLWYLHGSRTEGDDLGICQ